MAISPENRERFERAGLELVRLDYVTGGRRFIGAHNRGEAIEWMIEKEADNFGRDKSRFRLMVILTSIAAAAAFVAAIPVFVSWISN